MQETTLAYTDFRDLKLYKRGKVRDVYDLGDKLLIVSTDRISCFDVVLSDCIPYKGKVLNALSLFWFDFTQDICPNHLISASLSDYPKELMRYKHIIKDRSMLVKKVKSIPIECVVRGYLSGSGWQEYKEKQSVCGIKLPKGLKESDKLTRPIFTPATKEQTGHDINVSQKYLEEKFGSSLVRQLKNFSLMLYQKASQYAESRGIIIADTKFEFGLLNSQIILIDEVLTPDSSRFWPKEGYQPGKPQVSFDKQFVRDYLLEINWNKTPPAPSLPKEIIEKTTQKYLEAYRRITGKKIK